MVSALSLVGQEQRLRQGSVSAHPVQEVTLTPKAATWETAQVDF